jgi:spore coat protein U-like protein
MKSKIALGLALSLAMVSGAAHAATVTQTFQAKIIITSQCIFSTGGIADLDFGTQGILAANVDQQTSISVQCTNTTPYNIGLNAGTAPSATVTTRSMQNGAALVNYSLYRDAGRTLNWGNTVGTDTLSGTGTGAAVAHTVYGRVPPQTTPAAGSYADTVTVTVTY